MFKYSAGKVLWAFAFLALSVTPLQAAIIWDFNNPPPNGLTLAEINQAGGLIVLDKLFDQFVVTATQTVGAASPDINAIAVRGVAVGGEIGLDFFGGWTAFGFQILDTTIKFRVSILPDYVQQGYRIVDNSLVILASGAADTGQAAITEDVYSVDPDQVLNPTPYLLANKYVFRNAYANKLYDHVEFGQGLTEIWIIKDVIVSGGNSLAGSASLSSFRQTFSQIPEPATLALLALGVAVIFGPRRRH